VVHCPKCGHENPDGAMNCDNCRINLQFAITSIEQLKTQGESEDERNAVQSELESRVKQIICTTAPKLEGYRITQTLEVITAECVFGMNIFRDLFASVTDIIGGRSKASQKVLRDARRTCLFELKREAAEIGADAVIAIDLDYNEFSGGGKSMLFLVASGTAVKVEPISGEGEGI
jgi:uncharacterized protein YbjQ (UPF0145 family)